MKTHKTNWNLGLLYKNEKDPQIEKDLKAIEKACDDFEKKYKKADYISTEQKLFKALEESEKLSKQISGSKPWWYFALKMRQNSSDNTSTATATKFEQRLTVAGNKTTFFGLTIAKIPKNAQKKFLSSKLLAPYRYELARIFEHAKYNLSEAEEQVVSLLSGPGYGMWVDAQDKLLHSQTVLYKGKQIPITEATEIVSDLPTKERRELYASIRKVTKSVSHFAEAEINAVYNYKKIMDERRGYKKPYSATMLGYENDDKTIEGLVKTVTKHFTISRRFYKLHAKLLKEKKLTYVDRGAKIGEVKKKFDFETSVKIVRDVFTKIDPQYTKIFDSFLQNGQIDVYPQKGKDGGAFCWGQGDLPTFVLLNHADTLHSVETLAHEMGHAIHAELSKSQPTRYQGHTMSVAETASTFFEQAVSNELQNYLSKDEQIILLHNRLKGDVATIFRQIACFNFELELHTKIRVEGQVSKEAIAALLSKHMRAYLGESVEVTDDDGYFFVQWSHIRRFFYVYSYAYGQIISRALFENWQKDKSYAKKVEQFLSAGRSMSPEDIFKKAGIDTSKPAFFEAGLKSIERDIARLEKLTAKK